jgi:pSer/pThr/pTyr-binding forkhead associated (FHA) protein
MNVCPRCKHPVTSAGNCLHCTQSNIQLLAEIVCPPKYDLTPGRTIECLINIRSKARFSLSKRQMKIGRNMDNDLVLLDDPYISGSHAKITYSEGHWWIEDMGSRNGTFINNAEQVSEKTPLSQGDLVVFGQTVFRVQ